ncbi:MAG TPA: HlyD family secretion protein [Gemmataceae bacterium]|nr:HlyD family secretion protein [Gemmataceae bacterium]
MSSSETRGPNPSHPPPSAPSTGARRPRRLLRRSLLMLIVLAGVGGLVYWYLRGRIEVSTDNAYVVGNVTPISSEVSGRVVALFIDDNMIVQPGDPIAQIDPIAFQIHVDQALADYKQATAAAEAATVTERYTRNDRKSLLEGARAKRDAAEQTVKAAEVTVQTRTRLYEKDEELLASLQAQLPGLVALRRNAQDYHERFKNLARTGDVPVQDSDNREAAYREAVAKVESLQSSIKAAERQVLASRLQLQEAEIRLKESRKTLENAVALVGRAEAEQLQPDVAASTATAIRNKKGLAEAKLRLARLNLSNTLIRAPQAGIISRRTIQLGQTVEAHKPFLSIVPLDPDNVWIVANLREEQMARVRVGQPVTISVDGIPVRTFNGWVESVAGGTGSAFSLFPPDNATGNFVRVVQRLPVRIRLRDEEYENRIRPGMSSRITIDTTRYVRGSKQEW